MPGLNLGLEVFLGALASCEILRAFLAPKVHRFYSVLLVWGALKLAVVI